MTEPLWKRALLARELEQLRNVPEYLREAGRRAGYANRTHEKPRIGQVFGCLRIVSDLGPGRKGRADRSYECECVECGGRGPMYEFNIRREPRCSRHGWHKRRDSRAQH